MHVLGGEEIDPVGEIRRIPIKKGEVSEPSLVVVVAVGDDEALYSLESVAPYLLEKRGAAINEIAGLSYGHLVPDAFPHPGERAVVTKDM